jgi:hypothetical protein
VSYTIFKSVIVVCTSLHWYYKNTIWYSSRCTRSCVIKFKSQKEKSLQAWHQKACMSVKLQKLACPFSNKSLLTSVVVRFADIIPSGEVPSDNTDMITPHGNIIFCSRIFWKSARNGLHEDMQCQPSQIVLISICSNM